MSDKDRNPGNVPQNNSEGLDFYGANAQTVLNGRYAPILQKFQDFVNTQNSSGYRKQYQMVVMHPKHNKVEIPDLNIADQTERKTFQSKANTSRPIWNASNIFPSPSSNEVVSSVSQDFKSEECEAYSEPYKPEKDLEDEFTLSSQSPQISPVSQPQIAPVSQAPISPVSQAQISPVSQDFKSEDCAAYSKPSKFVFASSCAPYKPERDLEDSFSLSVLSPVSQAPISPVFQAPISPVSQAQISPVSQDFKSEDCAAYSKPSKFVFASSCAPYKPEGDLEDSFSVSVLSPVSQAPISPVSRAPNSPVSQAPILPVSQAPISPVSQAPISPVSQADYVPDEEPSQLLFVSSTDPERDSELCATYGQPLLYNDHCENKGVIPTEHLVSVKFQPISYKQLQSFNEEGETHILGHGRKFPNRYLPSSTPYKCGMCDITFGKSRDLNKHIKKHCNPWCAVCKTMFSSVYKLKSHRCLHQSICWICFERVKDTRKLGIHYRTHGVFTNEVMFSCAECDVMFPFARRYELCLHLLAKKSLCENLRFKCTNCTLILNTLSLFFEHMKTEHVISDRRGAFQCPVCSQIYVCKHNFQKHMKINKHRIKCSICCKFFISVGGNANKQFQLCEPGGETRDEGMINTMATKEGGKIGMNSGETDEDSSRCIQCKLRFKCKLTLLKCSLFQNIHKCLVCSRMFCKLFLLKSHMNIHVLYAHHSCYVCGKRFSHTRNLKLHMKTHVFHPNHSCKVCGRKFVHRHHLNLHTELHLREKFLCVICNKGFNKLYQFVRHRKLHPRSCTSRNKKDVKLSKRGKIYLKKGVRWKTTPHERKPCLCHICGKMFKLESDYNNHMTLHTRTE